MSANPAGDCFIDTNILVYAYDVSAGNKHIIAKDLVEQCWKNQNGCLSLQVLQEFFVSVTRKIAIPLDFRIARQIISDLTNWRVHAPETGDFLQAIDLQDTFQLSFWDAMILRSAVQLGCKQMFSEDLTHRQQFGEVLVTNPFMSEGG